MPVTIKKKGKKYQVSTPSMVHAKGTTMGKAQSQMRLLNAVDHGWEPTKGYGVGTKKGRG